MSKPRAPRNRTLTLTEGDRPRLRSRLLLPPADGIWPLPLPNGTIWGDCRAIAPQLPHASVDLLILDPPYNLTKAFGGFTFARQSVEDYTAWLDQQVSLFKPLLKTTASIYICGDWFSSASILTVAAQHFIVRNRITWEREKGRGAQRNWKNASEDIWFCTMSDDYVFNVEAVKLRRRVLAPYRHGNGAPKDWQATATGNYRDTHPSNFWSDITIPFWSMPENTPHPTQKSEKLIAKLILASSHPGDQVLDPYVGSGTTSVVAKKLGRRYLGIDLHEEYCLLTEQRLEQADCAPTIQGFVDGVFWERNTHAMQQMPRS
jgi:site-specific DNA-methyltransferase (adenine-specific)